MVGRSRSGILMVGMARSNTPLAQLLLVRAGFKIWGSAGAAPARESARDRRSDRKPRSTVGIFPLRMGIFPLRPGRRDRGGALLRRGGVVEIEVALDAFDAGGEVDVIAFAARMSRRMSVYPLRTSATPS
jgi:hypothetical protein